MSDELQRKVHDFLCDAKHSEFWRAAELHGELIGDGSERLLELKSILEEGVDDGIYERLIKKKGKERLVGYRIKGSTGEGTVKGERVDLSGWERKT